MGSAVASVLAAAVVPDALAAAPSIVGKPVVTYHRASSGLIFYETTVRTSASLPRTSSGSLLAGARINGFGPQLDFAAGERGGFTTAKSRRGRWCYTQSTIDIVTAPVGALAHPHPGLIVKVEVVIDGRPKPIVVHTRITRPATAALAKLCETIR